MALAGVLAASLAARAEADPLTVTVTPLSSFAVFSQQTRFGPLEWRGGLVLTSADRRFGGLSSLELSQDGSQLLAVSDKGVWFKARLAYDHDMLSGLADAEIAPMLDDQGKPLKGKGQADAEALAGWEPGRIDGRVIVGFERRARIGVYDLSRARWGARFTPLLAPPELVTGPVNHELEALGRFATGPLAGQIIAISELNTDPNGDIRAWIFGGPHPFGFTVRRHGEFAISDLAVLPGGDVLILERGLSAALLPAMAIRRIRSADVTAGRRVDAELLFEAQAPFDAIDNMEGMAVHERGGELRVTLVSDDNFNRFLQRTLILQFALRP